MYTLSQLRRRVDALKRKYALELSVNRFHSLAEEFSLEWTRAVGDRQELPQTHPFILRIAQHGFRFNTFINLHHYLARCRSRGDIPDCYDIIGALYPQITAERLFQLFEGRHPVPEPRPSAPLSETQRRAIAELLIPRWMREMDPSDWMVGWLSLYPFRYLLKKGPATPSSSKDYAFRYLSRNSMVRGHATAAPSSLCRSPVQSMKAWLAPA